MSKILAFCENESEPQRRTINLSLASWRLVVSVLERSSVSRETLGLAPQKTEQARSAFGFVSSF